MDSPTLDVSVARQPSSLRHPRWRQPRPPLARLVEIDEMDSPPAQDLEIWGRRETWLANNRWNMILFALAHASVFALAFVRYLLHGNLANARTTYGAVPYAAAEAAEVVLNFDLALIYLPVLRTFNTLLGQAFPFRNPLKSFQSETQFHRLLGHSMTLFACVHTAFYLWAFANFSVHHHMGFTGWAMMLSLTGPGWSGILMLLTVIFIFLTSLENPRKTNEWRFFITHLIGAIVLSANWSIHGAFCMIKWDTKPFCIYKGMFWIYWLCGAFGYVCERILQEYRASKRLAIRKIIQRSRDIEIQFLRNDTKTRMGQYIMINCPKVSVLEYHKFYLTSSPADDYYSFNLRLDGRFNRTLAKVLGCDIPNSGLIQGAENLPLPRIKMDGPFGSTFIEVFKFSVTVLVAIGDRLDIFASIMKTLLYKVQHGSFDSKIYLFLVYREHDASYLEWFDITLAEIQQIDGQERLEVYKFLTSHERWPRLSPKATQELFSPENDDGLIKHGGYYYDFGLGRIQYGVPNWDAIFRSIARLHGSGTANVFFAGPMNLASQLRRRCERHSSPDFLFRFNEEVV